MKHERNVTKTATVHAVNGRLVGPTLADPGMEKKVQQAQDRMFPNRQAVIDHFHKRGVLTRSGNLSKTQAVE